jgi:hypothetical protein
MDLLAVGDRDIVPVMRQSPHLADVWRSTRVRSPVRFSRFCKSQVRCEVHLESPNHVIPNYPTNITHQDIVLNSVRLCEVDTSHWINVNIVILDFDLNGRIRKFLLVWMIGDSSALGYNGCMVARNDTRFRRSLARVGTDTETYRECGAGLDHDKSGRLSKHSPREPFGFRPWCHEDSGRFEEHVGISNFLEICSC